MAAEFLQTTYEAGANVGGWDRPMLEPSVRPERPPMRPWSTLPSPGSNEAAVVNRRSV